MPSYNHYSHKWVIIIILCEIRINVILYTYSCTHQTTADIHLPITLNSALENKYLMKSTWNFFARSQGKGHVDEIRGTGKRTVWKTAMSRKIMGHNAQTSVQEAGNQKAIVSEIYKAQEKEEDKT